MIEIELTQPALIAGEIYPKGKKIFSTPENIEKGVKAYERQKKRLEIERLVGDDKSLLGTTADSASLTLLALAEVMVAIDESPDYATLQTKIKQSKFLPSSKDLLAKVSDGSVKLPALAKGIDSVYGDIVSRLTGVANILE